MRIKITYFNPFRKTAKASSPAGTPRGLPDNRQLSPRSHGQAWNKPVTVLQIMPESTQLNSSRNNFLCLVSWYNEFIFWVLRDCKVFLALELLLLTVFGDTAVESNFNDVISLKRGIYIKATKIFSSPPSPPFWPGFPVCGGSKMLGKGKEKSHMWTCILSKLSFIPGFNVH